MVVKSDIPCHPITKLVGDWRKFDIVVAVPETEISNRIDFGKHLISDKFPGMSMALLDIEMGLEGKNHSTYNEIENEVAWGFLCVRQYFEFCKIQTPIIGPIVHQNTLYFLILENGEMRSLCGSINLTTRRGIYQFEAIMLLIIDHLRSQVVQLQEFSAGLEKKKNQRKIVNVLCESTKLS